MAMEEKSALKIALEASGMSIEKISDKTNIRIAVIEDLLNNSVEVCGGIAYARGHIRSIAKVIKADADLLVSAIEAVLTGVFGNSWVGLSNANGDQIFNGQIYAGQSQTFSDPQLIKAVIGNAGAIKLELNGADLGIAGSDGQVVRLDFGTNGLSQS